MPTRSIKHMDINQIAKRILDEATGDAPKVLHGDQLTGKQAAGRKGGLVGGKKRMESLTDAERANFSAKGVASRKKVPVDVTGTNLVK